MFTKRIIPCLDVNKGRVVKGVNFVDLKDAGDPELTHYEEVRRIYRKKFDEDHYTKLYHMKALKKC